jgi:hypothetical protein
MNDIAINDIRRQMEAVRCNLGDEVEEIVGSARTLTDWRFYVRSYPWLCLAGAAAVGFWAVPKRIEIVSPSPEALEELAKRNHLVVNTNPQPQTKQGIGGALLGTLATLALRGAIGYVGKNASKFVAEARATHDGNGAEHRW